MAIKTGYGNLVQQHSLGGRSLVIDIGKTNAKVSLWSPSGELLDRRVRSNQRRPQSAAEYPVLDVHGIDAWLTGSIRELAATCRVERIVTIGHGAAATVLQHGKLWAEPMDYELEVAPEDRDAYDAQRDAFADTGSPALPQGLNLGVQLHVLEEQRGPLPEDAVILPWAQFWAWRFCGVAASEVSSLGCHTDLWRPGERAFSELAKVRGWARKMAPLRSAGHELGTVTADFAKLTGLNPDCRVLCGIHDSNAALHAARGHSAMTAKDATVLSTGTWFIAMRAGAKDAQLPMLQESRDCLVNVDAAGAPTPSARFMGGRELELAAGGTTFEATAHCSPVELLSRVPHLVEQGVMALPSFVEGVGPFPSATGHWLTQPTGARDLRVATDLYLALLTHTSLDLISSRGPLLVEGRIAQEDVYLHALASLRPEQSVFTSSAEHDVAYGALRLVDPGLPPPSQLSPVAPLSTSLDAYATRWRNAEQNS